MDKKTETLFFTLFFLLMSGASVVDANEETAACKAAVAPVNYGDLFVVPDDTKALIESYRDDWRRFCGDGASRPALSEILKKGQEIDIKFAPILEDRTVNIQEEAARKRSNAISELITKKYPQFIPAFHGSYIEYTYFQSAKSEFRNNAPRGTKEDQLFFNSLVAADQSYPWIRLTWDYGGCIQYGEFDWIPALEELVQLKKKLKSQVYLQYVSIFEESLFGDPGLSILRPAPTICTCEEKTAVLKDVKKIAQYLEKEPAYAKYRSAIQKKIDQISSEEVTVNSQKEKHCSGG